MDDNRYVFDVHAIKDKLKKIRKLNKLTQEEAAEKIDISVNGLAKIESHKSTLALSIRNLINIANAYNVDINYLFRKDENEDMDSTEVIILSIIRELSDKDKKLLLDIASLLKQNQR